MGARVLISETWYYGTIIPACDKSSSKQGSAKIFDFSNLAELVANACGGRHGEIDNAFGRKFPHSHATCAARQAQSTLVFDAFHVC